MDHVEQARLMASGAQQGVNAIAWMGQNTINKQHDNDNNDLNARISESDRAIIAAYLVEMLTARANGQTLSEENETDFTKIAELVRLLETVQFGDTTGFGEDLRAFLVQELVRAGFEVPSDQGLSDTLNDLWESSAPPNQAGDALDDKEQFTAKAAALIDAFSTSLKDHDFDGDVKAVTANLKQTLGDQLSPSTLNPVAQDAMTGLALGIRTGKADVVREMRSAARAAVNAAKGELKISSPSRVFRDEVGAMTMKGLGEGITQEAKGQARIMRNAARYLTSEAKEGSVGYPARTDNSRTYNSNASVNLSGNSFYIRDQQDIRSLAVEIATLTKRQQRGRGLRMA